ncbi:ribonuclease E inhibitor RraB [Terriglobus roseus]|uniref:Regulator of ribonuclease activity B n=1 Tax=Terriglobus roseus TaxID=392734 RepID=A0A1H4TKT4_9BACT|nr:ribonuclease E inhibitor RraB [Terriglobus roseus]SEC57052.1 Regulator of ribonuclease activity B [Terriglobus roseus]
MTTEASAKENLDQQLANNTARLKELVDQQYNVEVTRSIVLCFSSDDDECARALIKALFAKGTRVLQPEPEKRGDRFQIRVGVKRSLRDTVREEFVSDMVHTASGMNGTFDGWNLLGEESAEQAQTQGDTPDARSAGTLNS